MSIELWASILAGAIVLATPLVIAGLGEGFVERAGRLNLGIEGMMILGAFVAVFVASFSTNYNALSTGCTSQRMRNCCYGVLAVAACCMFGCGLG